MPHEGLWAGYLGVIGFPVLASAIAKMVLGRMSWTRWRLFRAKRRMGGVFVALCVWQAAVGARQMSHIECAQAASWHEGDCVEWRRLPGGDIDHVLLFMALGGSVLWWIARLKEPAMLEWASLLMGDKSPDDID